MTTTETVSSVTGPSHLENIATKANEIGGKVMDNIKTGVDAAHASVGENGFGGALKKFGTAHKKGLIIGAAALTMATIACIAFRPNAQKIENQRNQQTELTR